MVSCATRPKARRRAVWSHLACRTSSCTTCWTNGSSTRCDHGLQADVPLSASPMMPSWRSRMCLTPNASLVCWASGLARYGLTLHPDKTRFVDFRNTASNGMADPATNGTTFTFLGFTYIWGKSRAGKNVVRLVTAKNRYSRALAAVAAWCRFNRHQPIPDQHHHLTAMMRGHYAYYGITGNSRRLIPNPIDQNPWAHWRSPMDMMRQG